MIEPSMTNFDTSKFKLGSLCKRGHDYEGTGMSLRFISSRECRKCSQENSKKQRRENQKYHKEYYKKYYDENKERIKEYARDYAREYNKTEKEKERKKKWHEENKEYGRSYKAANPEKARYHCQKRLTMIKRQGDGSVTTKRVHELIAAAIRCCYCFKEMAYGEKTLDHMIPLSKKGSHSICNLVVCCADCNRRKFNKSYSDWLDCLDPKQRKSAERLYYKRCGVSPLQGVLPLVFEQEDKSDE